MVSDTPRVVADEPTEAAADEPGLHLGKAARGAGWLGLGAAVVKTAQTVVLLALAALLAPEAMGVLAIGALVLNVTSAVTDLGSSTALVYWRGDAQRAARSALTLALGFAVVLTVGAWFLAPTLASALNTTDDGTGVIRGLMLCLPFLSVAGVSQELLRRDLAFRRRVAPDIASALLGATVSIALAANDAGVYSLVVGQLVQAVTVMVLCWAMRPPVLPGWSTEDVRGLIAYGGHLAGANVLNLLMLNVDYVLVARVLGATSLGVYSMSFRLAYMPYLLVGMVVAGAAFAFLCRLDGPAVGRAVAQVGVALAVVAVPLHVGMLMLAPQLTLLGDKWEPGVPPLRWLAVYGLVLTAVHLAIVALNAVSRTRDGLLLTGLHLVLLSGLLLWWTPQGVEMVAVAQVVAGLGTLAATIPVFRRHVQGFRMSEVLMALWPAVVGAAAMAVVGWVAHHVLPWTVVSPTGLVLVGVLMVAAYAVPVWCGRRRLLDVVTDLRRSTS